MTRAKARPEGAARDDGEAGRGGAGSAAAKVRELEEQVHRLAQANRQLAEREARLRALFEAEPDAIAVVARDGTLLDLNPAALRLIELDSLAQLGGFRLETLAADPARIACRGLAERVLRGDAATIELEITSLKGTRRWIETHATPLRGEDGRIPALVCVARDITGRRAAEQALRQRESELRESEARFRNMAEHSPLIVWMTDASGLCSYVNQRWYEFSGQPPGGALGRGFFAAVHAEDAAEGRRAFDETVSARAPWRHEYRVRRRDGVYRHMLDTASPRSGPHGEFLGYIGVLVDIQDLKDAEEARQRLEAPLRQAQKMEALGTLAGGVAHDFNNILGTILGNVQLARDELAADHPVQESLAEIARAGERARELVQQILTFGRRQPDDRRVVDLREVVEESVRLLRATLPAGIDLVTTFGPGVPNVLADRSRVHQVLMNLCANAWQAIDGGVGRITVSLAPAGPTATQGPAELPPGRYACLTVSDTGRGIEPDVVERMFDPFFTTKGPGQGTGLGLSVVDGIVKGHGGAVTVETAVGHGATFRVYFPAVEGRPAPPAEPPRTQPGVTGQRVLYLDDEVSLVHLASRLLGRLGYQVEGFTRPADALAAFAADPGRFDVVVSDMNMPKASGLSVAAEMLQRRPDLPIALISGFVTDELAERAHALGVRAVIYKPNLARELAPLIGRLLS